MAELKLLALDLGAESGRAVVGHLDGRTLRLEEVHRFPNGPVRVNGHLHWDALRLYGELSWPATVPRWLAPAHRWSGTIAFVATIPVAYHCLWSLGYESIDTRHVAHSIMGCAFYGAFTTKMLVLRSQRVPGWALPAVGGLVFVILVGIWLTAALWFFANVTFPGF